MAASDVQIAKLALQHIGDRYDITSLTDATPEAEQINLVYVNVRDSLIRQYPWKFALRYVSPSTLAGTTPAGWTYMFSYPAEALRVWRIVNPLDPRGDTLPPIEWDTLRNANDNQILVSDEQEPEFEYSKRVTNSSEFDVLFDWAFSWALASAIAMPITGDMNIRNAVAQEARLQIGNAQAESANEGSTREVNRDADWIRERG